MLKEWTTASCTVPLAPNEVDVINSYTTDGQLQEYDLRVLEDDKSFFPPYHALPLVRKEALKEYPELEEVLRST